MSRIFRTIAVSVFFIGFPLVSWYYLNQGYDYRMKVLGELREPLGETPPFELLNQNGIMVSKKQMKDKVVIANFVALNAINQSSSFMADLYTIQDQFDKKDDILFYTFIQADSLQAVKKYVQSLNIKEEKQWQFLTGTNAEMGQFIKAYPFPAGIQKEYAGNYTVAIADTSSIIRHFYNMNDSKEASDLIVHIANLMPQAAPELARTKRELEKE